MNCLELPTYLDLPNLLSTRRTHLNQAYHAWMIASTFSERFLNNQSCPHLLRQVSLFLLQQYFRKCQPTLICKICNHLHRRHSRVNCLALSYLNVYYLTIVVSLFCCSSSLGSKSRSLMTSTCFLLFPFKKTVLTRWHGPSFRKDDLSEMSH